tara:strand:+ start:189 stop:584 length:396 start_codon:yes stop_codon:yes gene_type:complete
MKNKYYYLVLPNEKVDFEAIEEVFREQEAYDKKFFNFSSRSGYVFSKNNINKLPSNILKDVTSSNFFRNLKLNSINSINLRTIFGNNFTIFVSTNKEFITWVTLKIVEIENSKEIDKNKLINYDGFLSNLS